MDKRKNNGGHSTKGYAGRKPLHDELKGVELASPHVKDAFKTIAGIMLNEKSNSRDKIAAAKILIEYGCGKPKETIEQTTTLSNFNIKELFSFDSNK
jgi:hypothetical protein